MKLAEAFEIEELRKAPVELKLLQLWSLMTAADLFDDGAARDGEVLMVRERWARLHQAICD
ncbi:MAG: hypothetical protein ACRET4_09195 [Steroidobacteraceae bacterium]